VLDQVRASGPATILVVARNVRDRALHLLLQNRAQGRLNVIAVKAPSFGTEMLEMLEDLAALTGATVVSEGLGATWDDVPLEWLGRCRRAVVNRTTTVILEGEGREPEIQDRQRQIRAQLAQAYTDVDRRRLERRIARLGEAVGMLLVGGITEQERRARKDKADDAVAAVRRARESGVVPGGGAAYLRAQEAVAREAEALTGDAATGAHTLHDALEAPIRRIARNAGEQPSVVLDRVRRMEPWGTWDALRRDYVDAYAGGLLDPLATKLSSLQAAVSVGQMVLTTDAIVCEKRSVPIPRTPRIAATRGPF
ncbi:MAG: chaperonin GroEL, partial [Chloroflexi bacterium]|nr:chaperonin GroEL [Chloroflexota bacterium]